MWVFLSSHNSQQMLKMSSASIHARTHARPPARTHARTVLIMDCRTISKVLVPLQMFCQASKCVGEVSFHFQLELNTLGVLSIPKDKNIKD
jgi:hypothetical protein